MKKTLKILLSFFAVLIITLFIMGIVSRDKIEIPVGFDGDYITISDVKIRYKQIGTGKDLLFIHGVPGSIEDWEPIMDSLSSRYRLTIYDRPGHGFSGAKNIGYDLDHNARIALGIIKELKLQSVIVIGHSYGGSIVMAMAVQNPPQVKGFIAVGGATYEVAHIDPLFRVIGMPLVGRGLAALASGMVGTDMVNEGVKAAFHPNETAMSADYIETRKGIWLQTKVICSIAYEEVNLNPDLRAIIPRYGSIAKRFIVIHGADDQLVPAEHSERLHSALKDSSLIILKGIGHQIQYVRPDVVIKAIDEMSKRRSK